ncbi:MAG TPA: methyltransferase domain-containing protein [Ktedonobacteraceae bacterium]|nr:methyltransferase domain-containing protein [Ktedonobacteraceae bacterium]
MSTDPSEQNSYIIDAEDPAEMARLIQFDRVTTKAMGGPLAEQPEATLAQLRNVLDLGCGPGSWVLDVAFALPDCEVAGVDISRTMINYANARARSQKLTNASFGVMDVTQPLDFADNSFDLVNARFLINVFHKDHWPMLMKECVRILRPGGILRWTETDRFGLSNSPAGERLMALALEAEWRAGYTFSPDGRSNGITPMLGLLMRNAGIVNIQQKPHLLDYSAGTEAWQDMYDNARVGAALMRPFLTKLGVISEAEFDQLYQQAMTEMQAPDFRGLWYYMTAWGNKP